MTEQANQPATTAAKTDSATADAKPPPKPESKPKQKPPPGRTPWRIAGVLFVIIVLGGIWISWPVWSPSLPGWLRGSRVWRAQGTRRRPEGAGWVSR